MEQTVFLQSAQNKALYRVAGTVALFITLAGLIDAITSMGIEARDNSTVNIIEWFALFQISPFKAFSSLGVINMLTLTLSIPIYIAYNQAFREDHPTNAAFASILFFIGTVVYLSSNTVFSLFAISTQYATAAEAQKPLLEAAGRALLAQGADLTPGTFAGLFFTQIAGILITCNMLRGKVFGKWTGRAGLVGFSLMAIFFILTAFVPEHYSTAMLIAAPGGLILMTYQILLARRFFQLGR
jgi:hypothetical protein